MADDISAFLEVPETIIRKDIEKFLEPFCFEIPNKNEPVLFNDTKTKVYIIKGLEQEYKKLEKVVLHTSYKLWPDSQFEALK